MHALRHRLLVAFAALGATFALAACDGDDGQTGVDPVDDGVEIEDSVGGDAEGSDDALGADDADGFTDGEDGDEDAEG